MTDRDDAGDAGGIDDGEEEDCPWSNAPTPPDSLGLARGTVELVPYRGAWVTAFEREAARLEAALGEDAVAVEHVGSTAVQGLPAKPILDVAVGVPDLAVARRHRERGTLRDLGYAFRGTDDVPDRLFFARGPPERRTHYVSVTPVDGETFREQVAFRDALEADDALREAYAALKRDLASTHGDERERYTAEKSAFVERVLASVGVQSADSESTTDR
ncbi:GrpB family protein [Halorubellus sp. JP-L1]|uniref:GrpB family protein n=1 Tax=Halorubellus sp. JP-L1 TaxID=2715753 RepID=UPI0014099932|nr:GrpB family protein [Halorubellus sp. JP-L1]NHN41895.1 GrpB family protein [Halorubellus sp. JP-L1]